MKQYHWEWGLALRMPYLIWQETVYATTPIPLVVKEKMPKKIYVNHDLVFFACLC